MYVAHVTLLIGVCGVIICAYVFVTLYMYEQRTKFAQDTSSKVVES